MLCIDPGTNRAEEKEREGNGRQRESYTLVALPFA